VVSLARLQELSGIDVFPGLPEEVKQAVANLPQPRLRRQPSAESRTRRRPPPDGGSRVDLPSRGEDFVGGILEAIDRIGRR
jgi:hypothetical protein